MRMCSRVPGPGEASSKVKDMADLPCEYLENKVAVHVGAGLPLSCRDRFPSRTRTCEAPSQSASISSTPSQVSEPHLEGRTALSLLFAPVSSQAPNSQSTPSPISLLALSPIPLRSRPSAHLFPNKRGNSENAAPCNSVILFYFSFSPGIVSLGVCFWR